MNHDDHDSADHIALYYAEEGRPRRFPDYVISNIEQAGTCRHCGRVTGHKTELCSVCRANIHAEAIAARARALNPVPKCRCGREVIPGYDECGQCA